MARKPYRQRIDNKKVSAGNICGDFLMLFITMFLLEEEVAVVNYVSLEIKLVHEVACPLQCLLV